MPVSIKECLEGGWGDGGGGAEKKERGESLRHKFVSKYGFYVSSIDAPNIYLLIVRSRGHPVHLALPPLRRRQI